jgi:hypothetical protein
MTFECNVSAGGNPSTVFAQSFFIAPTSVPVNLRGMSFGAYLYLKPEK